MRYLLGLESTCDDSSLGVFDISNQKILYNKVYSQDELHGKFGGVVPEIASRSHFEILPILVKDFFIKHKIAPHEIAAFAVSSSPGLIGSLLVGINFMKSLAWSYDKKILGVDHLESHLLSVLLENKSVTFPYLCFLLSGGHSIAVIVEKVGQYKILGSTQDDALGESFDKVAKILGLKYPGGPAIEELASLWKGSLFSLPIPLKNRQDYHFSYSGLKTAVKKLALQHNIDREKKELVSVQNLLKQENQQTENILKIAASFQKTVFDSLLWNFQKILKKHTIQNFAIAGGVASNRFLVESFRKVCEKQKIGFFTPKREYCTDNGAMVAFCGYLYQKYQIQRSIQASSKSFLFPKFFEGLK